jgi:hypothetical protein
MTDLHKLLISVLKAIMELFISVAIKADFLPTMIIISHILAWRNAD